MQSVNNPAHPTLFNDRRNQINRVNPLTMVIMSAKFDE